MDTSKTKIRLHGQASEGSTWLNTLSISFYVEFPSGFFFPINGDRKNIKKGLQSSGLQRFSANNED